MKRIIGVTGGLGAGKSTVLSILKEEYGARVILADEVGRSLMEPGQSCYEEIIRTFGEDMRNEDGSLNREKLGSEVFQNAKELSALNRIIHPAVKQKIREEILKLDEGLIVIEAALLVEDHYDEICDELWYVYAPTQERVKRLYENRGYSEVKSYSIIHNQLSVTEFKKACDYLIDNGGSLEHVREQIATRLHAV